MNRTNLDHVEETLRRLGIEELEERLELSPVIASDGDTPGDDGGGCCRQFCQCEVVLPEQLKTPWIGR